MKRLNRQTTWSWGLYLHLKSSSFTPQDQDMSSSPDKSRRTAPQHPLCRPLDISRGDRSQKMVVSLAAQGSARCNSSVLISEQKPAMDAELSRMDSKESRQKDAMFSPSSCILPEGVRPSNPSFCHGYEAKDDMMIINHSSVTKPGS
jgi:hypothetical protein